jgi:two-component sensor histidine kinase
MPRKYGALSVEEGKLDIAATMKGEIPEIVWLESRSPRQAASEPRSIGFGSRLEQIIGQSLGVDISREWMPDGLAIRLSIPAALSVSYEPTQPARTSIGRAELQDVGADRRVDDPF